MATRFIDQFGEDLRYVPKWKLWLAWDGRRFVIDDDAIRVRRLAREFAKRLWEDALQVASDNRVSRDESSTAISYVRSVNRKSTIESFIGLAKSDWRVTISHTELDTNLDLLNFTNGTFDLSEGAFREHRRDDLITQLAGVAYGENAECPKWLAALDLIFDGDAELIRYVRQILGYSLAGDAGEHLLPIAFGSGANGKSFLWNAVIALTGDYGCVANDSLLLGERNAHPTERAHLYQKRIVAVSEPEQGCKMKESRVKELTGDAFVTARRMKEDLWTFRRTHTFWLSTNHLPMVAGNDEGIWRRLKVIPFGVDLRERTKLIPNYHEILVSEEGPGILKWLLDGFRDYRQHGFIEPEAVKRLGRENRSDQDHLGQFVKDCCVESPESCVSGGDLQTAYKRWNGHLTTVAFGKEMTKRYRKEKASSGPNRGSQVYFGIGLSGDQAKSL